MDNYIVETIDISSIPPKIVLHLLENIQVLSKLSLYDLIPFYVDQIDKNFLRLRYNESNCGNIYKKMYCRCKLKELLNVNEGDLLKSIKNESNERLGYLEDEIMLEYENFNNPYYNKQKKKFLKHKYEFIVYNNFPIDPFTKDAFKDAIRKCRINIGQLVLNNIKYSENQSDYDYLCYNIRNIYIREISITHSEIDDKGFKYLCKNFKSTPHLHNLHLTYDYISDVGMKYFNEYSSYITELTGLDLKSNFITDDGVKYICDSFSNISSLEYLRLDDNECISDEGLKTLIQYFKFIPELRVLEIYENNITEDGVELLDEALGLLPKFEKVDNAMPVSGLLNAIDGNDEFNPYL